MLVIEYDAATRPHRVDGMRQQPQVAAPAARSFFLRKDAPEYRRIGRDRSKGAEGGSGSTRTAGPSDFDAHSPIARAAALALASALRPDLEPALRRVSSEAAAANVAEHNDRKTGARLLESRPLAARRRPPFEMEADVRPKTSGGVICGPVRSIDGRQRLDLSRASK
jgi:hypothetical protein